MVHFFENFWRKTVSATPNSRLFLEDAGQPATVLCRAQYCARHKRFCAAPTWISVVHSAAFFPGGFSHFLQFVRENRQFLGKSVNFWGNPSIFGEIRHFLGKSASFSENPLNFRKSVIFSGNPSIFREIRQFLGKYVNFPGNPKI